MWIHILLGHIRIGISYLLKYKYNEYSRKLFDEKYSFDVSLKLFELIFNTK